MAIFAPPLSESEIQVAFPGRFTNLTPVDAGGQGCVFRGETLDGSAVALKVYVPDPGARVEERTEREVQALRAMRCPAIVSLEDFGTVSIRNKPCRFVTTPFIDGVTVSQLVNQSAMSVAMVAQLAHDVSVAIGAMWSPARIVHRDIKPNNVMWTRGDRAVVIDLGLARHLSLESLTVTGGVCGTFGFMSPEQFSGSKQLSCKSDVFALGVLLQYCLNRQHPTGGDQWLLAAGAPATSQLAPATPVAMAAVVDLMLRRNPVERPLPTAIADFFRTQGGALQ
ncbi:MAG TPA: serine/threonine-protein kinase [Vicinamibacterales bacterium]|nr:serine/threonine-protein kinase [Vicinamibacterales bacterium]